MSINSPRSDWRSARRTEMFMLCLTCQMDFALNVFADPVDCLKVLRNQVVICNADRKPFLDKDYHLEHALRIEDAALDECVVVLHLLPFGAGERLQNELS